MKFSFNATLFIKNGQGLTHPTLIWRQKFAETLLHKNAHAVII